MDGRVREFKTRLDNVIWDQSTTADLRADFDCKDVLCATACIVMRSFV